MPPSLSELLDPRYCALVLQEVQNGVVGGSSVLPALADAAAAVDLVANCARLATAARAAGLPVFHCTAETRADGIGANRNARLFAAIAKADVKLAPGTEAVHVPDPIGMKPGDVALPRHHGLGPMTGTQLDPMLRNLGVRTIVGVGVSVNIGITSLAFDAVNWGYQIVLPRDAIAGVPREYADAVIDNTLALVATLTTTAAVVDVWSRARPGT